MKRVFLAALVPFLFGGVFAVDSLDATKWAYEQELIRLDGEFLGSSTLKREEFAPFFLDYIYKVAKKDYREVSCKVVDIHRATYKYQEDLKKICAYGLTFGEKGYYYPHWKLTSGQAVAFFMRALDGAQDESTEGGRHWTQGYFERAKDLGYDVAPLTLVRNNAISFENLINFMYSTAHPHVKVLPMEQDPATETKNYRSSEEVLKAMAEILQK